MRIFSDLFTNDDETLGTICSKSMDKKTSPSLSQWMTRSDLQAHRKPQAKQWITFHASNHFVFFCSFTVGESRPSLGRSSPRFSNDISPMESLKFCKRQSLIIWLSHNSICPPLLDSNGFAERPAYWYLHSWPAVNHWRPIHGGIGSGPPPPRPLLGPRWRSPATAPLHCNGFGQKEMAND